MFRENCLKEIIIPELESFATARQDCQKYIDQVSRPQCLLPLQDPNNTFKKLI